jgi:alpha-L-fucosidase
MVREVIYQYEPEMLWFDIAFDGRKCISPEYQQRMFADYYNWAVVNATNVCVGHKEREILPHTGIIDYERGRSEVLLPAPWVTDTTISRSWFYQPRWDGQWKDANWIIDLLIDIVSKNGIMMLNVAFKSNGTLIEEGTVELEKIGKWLRLNGQAIYETRPWKVYGEPHKALSERHGRGDEQEKVVYSSEDVRFTRSKDNKTVYAILLGWPGNDKQVTIQSMNSTDFTERIQNISLIGHYGEISWQQTTKGLTLRMPHKQPCDYAYCFELKLKE